ncbi:OLC1v1001605C1 [Oldenlandia corymbosa var. corymbosa]|uniref:OLC1v1001605C1 n=1 Tax=Oldenlandia corymbosa var. corymbosa TaxID=529605 RepID=A0AAV1D5L8_OLDCO|nr:OLC1v1001605C1 [Oldenlandia corymbosa var. corymbosa]
MNLNQMKLMMKFSLNLNSMSPEKKGFLNLNQMKLMMKFSLKMHRITKKKKGLIPMGDDDNVEQEMGEEEDGQEENQENEVIERPEESQEPVEGENSDDGPKETEDFERQFDRNPGKRPMREKEEGLNRSGQHGSKDRKHHVDQSGMVIRTAPNGDGDDDGHDQGTVGVHHSDPDHQSAFLIIYTPEVV